MNSVVSTCCKRIASRVVGISFFFLFSPPVFHFSLTMIYWLNWEKNNLFSKIMKKRSSRPFSTHSGGLQETTFWPQVSRLTDSALPVTSTTKVLISMYMQFHISFCQYYVCTIVCFIQFSTELEKSRNDHVKSRMNTLGNKLRALGGIYSGTERYFPLGKFRDIRKLGIFKMLWRFAVFN